MDGAPTDIRALAQTTDGYLWLGTGSGLFRFDGMRFTRFEPRPGEAFPGTRIGFMLAARDGSLWIVFRPGKVSRLRDGHVTSYSGIPLAFTLVEGRDGTIIAGTANGLLRFRDGVWKDVGREWEFPARIARHVYYDKSGALWVFAEGRVVYLPAGESRFVDAGKIGTGGGGFAQAPDGTIWLADTYRSAHTVARSRDLTPLTEVRVGATSVLFDRSGSLWISSAGDGLRRVAYPDRINGHSVAQYGPEAEQFTVKNGLSGDYVHCLLEDREGNIWSGTLRGLDRFRPSVFTPVSVDYPDAPRGVMGFKDGSLWTYGSGNAQVLRIGPRGDQEVLLSQVPTISMCEDAEGSVWTVSGTLLFRWRAGFKRVPLPEGAGPRTLIGIACDQAGVIWLFDRANGLLRFYHGALRRISVQSAPDELGYLYLDRRGRVWLGQYNHVTLYDHGKLQDFGRSDGLPAGGIFTFFNDRLGNLWAGGDGGLSKFENGRFRAIAASHGLAARSVFGVAEDDLGYWWLATESGVLRVSPGDLDAAVEDPAYRVHYQSFNTLDGLPGKPRQGEPLPVVGITTDGRIWFATTNGIAYADSRRIPMNNVPPPVHIESAKMDGKEVRPEDGMALSHRTNDLEIDYTGLSLSIPERVLFRYKLEGKDTEWHDVGTRRQAYYSSLAPKKYTFRVIACNNDGVWNEAGAAWAFSISPAFYQTYWFEALYVLAIALLLAGAYQLRIRQIARAMNARFDERLAERTRLAREFHDTLLQTIQGSKMVADDALKHASDAGRMRNAMERLSEWLGQAIQEGRTALSSLRSSTTERNDMAEALRRAGEECQFQRPIDFVLSVQGASRELHPIVRDEVYRIGYEAIRNACVHSEGNLLKVELDYVEDLVLRVGDNGKGIDPELAANGKGGHFGVTGMYERASRLHGRLTISSSSGSGTQVKLVVPDSIAFRQPDPGERTRFLHRLRFLQR